MEKSIGERMQDRTAWEEEIMANLAVRRIEC